MRVVVVLILVLALVATLLLLQSDGPAAPGGIDASTTDEHASSASATQPGADLEVAGLAEPVERDGAARIEVIPPAGTGKALVRGRLVQAGEPLPNVTITVGELVNEQADAQGRFAFVLPMGNHTLALRGLGVPYRYAIGPLRVAAQQQIDVGDLPVPAAVTVTGRVVDEGGLGVAGVRVYAATGKFHRDLGAEDEGADRHTLSGPDGTFSISGMRPGEVKTRAERRGFLSQSADVVIAHGTGDVGLLVLRAAAPLLGFVVDQQGAPVEGALVMAGGGRYSRVERRLGVRTRADGGFDLPGYGKRWRLTVEAPGFAPTSVDDVHEMRRPIRVALPPAVPLRIHVNGLEDHEATFVIVTPDGDYRATPSWMNRYTYGSPKVGEHGWIHIDHVPAGKWVLRVRASRFGSVPTTPFETPREDLLEVQLVRDVMVPIAVVDTDGVAVSGAEVIRVDRQNLSTYGNPTPEQRAKRWFDAGVRERYRADDQGRVRVFLPEHMHLRVAARAPGYLANLAALPRGEIPELVTITIAQGGSIRGVVRDASLHASVGLAVWGAGSMPVDSRGTFSSGTLKPGSYKLQLLVEDRTHFADDKLPLLDPVPAIDGIVEFGPGAVQTVEVRAGEQAFVEFDAPNVGDVTGRVLAAGRPVEGALVYGRLAEEKVFPGAQGMDAHDFHPSTRTDANGVYRFLIAKSGTLELRARRASAGTWTESLVLSVDASTNLRDQDIHLPAATIRGRYDVSAIAPADRRFFSAQLYSAAQAAGDPFFMPHHGSSIEFDVPRQSLGTSSTFAFEGLLPGTWVLRLVTRDDQIKWQRAFTIVSDEVIDLGLIEDEEQVQPQLTSGLSNDYGVWIRRIQGDVEHAAFVATQWAFTAEMKLPKLPPGDYLLVPFTRGENHWGIGVSGQAVGETVRFTLRQDGTTVPAEVWPDGI